MNLKKLEKLLRLGLNNNMNILYGVAGEGLGHASHALEIATFLEKKRKDKVIIVTYDQAYDVLKNKFKVVKVRGLHPIYDDGVLRYRKTLFFNLRNFTKNIKEREKLKELIKQFKPDVCITDMEPVTSFLAYLYNIPLISLSNQNRFTNLDSYVPKKYLKDYLIAKSTIKLINLKPDYYIALSLSDSKIKKENTYIVSPIIKEDIRKLKPKNKDKILVYLSKENKQVIDLLKKTDEKFIVYGYNINKKEENLEFKTPKTFNKDFGECKAIISTSGFTSMGEAIYLKKPYLALPLKGQFEQMFNALFLEEHGLGNYSEKLNLDQLNDFIFHIEKYKRNLENFSKKRKLKPEKVLYVLNNILNKIDKTSSIIKSKSP
ncbi:MAG: glycosyltransferase family protein [archaeon]|nr:glycosyltransferase family protein [archaeon]